MYSQNDEEKYILGHFAGVTGRFYDIGAADGKLLSNTYALLKQGWRGVEVEPDPINFIYMRKGLSDFQDQVDMVNAAVSTTKGLTPFWDSGGNLVSTISENHYHACRPQFPYMENLTYYINPVTPAELFDTFGPAEFISLDVEGNNLAVFRELPFAWPELSMICVELEEPDKMVALAAEHGFRELHRTSENLLLAR